MKTRGKFSSILAAVMVMCLALPGGASAGGRYDKGGNGHGYPQKGQSGGHYNNHNKNTYNNYYNNYYGGGYSKGGGYYKGGRYYYPNKYGYNNYCYKNKQHHHNNNNSNDDLWIGLLGGGIVGYTLSNIYPAR